jgi:hypothetical protein
MRKKENEKMKNMRKKLVRNLAIVLVVILSATTLVGCGGWKESDAVNYIKSALDAASKGEYKEYAKITKQTEAEAKEEYLTGIDSAVSSFAGMGFSEGQQDDLKQMVIDLYKGFKYDVKGATKEGDNFKVTVEIEPFTGFADIQNEIKAGATREAAEAAGVDLSNTQAVTEWSIGLALDIMKGHVANPTYGDKQELTVTITKLNNVYQVSPIEIQNLMLSLMGMK